MKPSLGPRLGPDEVEAVLLKLEVQERRPLGTVCKQWLGIVRRHQSALTLGARGEGDWEQKSGAEDLPEAVALRPRLDKMYIHIPPAYVNGLMVSAWPAPAVGVLQAAPQLRSLTTVAEGIPEEVPPCLPLLQHLEVWGCSTLPTSLGDLSSLTGLTFSPSPFKGATPVGLPPSITRLSRLHRLAVEGDGSEAFAPWSHVSVGNWRLLCMLPALRQLCMSQICLEDLDWLQSLTQLRSLSLACLYYEGEAPPLEDGAHPVENAAWAEQQLHRTNDALAPLSQLEELSLVCLSLRELPPSIAAMRRLHTLKYSSQAALERLPTGPYQHRLHRLTVGLSHLHTHFEDEDEDEHEHEHEHEAGSLLTAVEGMSCLQQLSLGPARVLDIDAVWQRLVGVRFPASLQRLSIPGGAVGAGEMPRFQALRQQFPNLDVTYMPI